MPTNTARQLRLRLGSEAAPAAALCREECSRLGEKRAERFWTDVADHLRAMMDVEQVSPSPSVGELAPASRTWLIMQRVERYRHRAMQAECKAAGSEAHRGLMLELAAQWLDLAKQAERGARADKALGDVRRSARAARRRLGVGLPCVPRTVG